VKFVSSLRSLTIKYGRKRNAGGDVLADLTKTLSQAHVWRCEVARTLARLRFKFLHIGLVRLSVLKGVDKLSRVKCEERVL
jgi:hypothetical protein